MQAHTFSLSIDSHAAEGEFKIKFVACVLFFTIFLQFCFVSQENQLVGCMHNVGGVVNGF